MENRPEFTESETKVRRRWLFCSTLRPAFVLGYLVAVAIFKLFIAADFTAIIEMLLFSLIPAGGLYLNYYCAYKNPGTILLLLAMIGIPLNLLTTILKPKNLALMKTSIVFLLLVLLMLTLEVILFYYSYKLRKINKKMQERKLMTSPVYVNAISVFSTATNLEELDEQFTKLKAPHDAGSAIESLFKAYNQQKKTLNLVQ